MFDDEAALGLSDLTEDHLGEAGEVIITKDDTIFLKVIQSFNNMT